MLDNSAIGVWQYVSIPVSISGNTIVSVQIRSKDFFLNGISISDVRLCVSPRAGWYVKNADDAAAVDDVREISYRCEHGTFVKKSISETCFMTEKDLQATFISMYRNRLAGQKLTSSEKFVLSLCDGTRKVWVTEVSLYAPKIINRVPGYQEFPLAIETVAATDEEPEHGVASFYHEMRSPEDTVTTNSYMMFYPSMTVGNYTGDVIRQRTVAQTQGKHTQASETNTYADFFGRTLQEVDEYGLTTTYEYDANGAMCKKTVGRKEISEKLVYEVTRTQTYTEEKTPLNYHKVLYSVPLGYVAATEYCGNDQTVVGSPLRSICHYDAYGRKLERVCNDLGNQNILSYGSEGRLRAVSPANVSSGSSYGYRIAYDRYGEPSQYFLQSSISAAEHLLSEKETDYAAGTITTKQYRADTSTPDTVTVTLDKYGRTECIQETSVDENGSFDTKFERQELWESDGAAEVTSMNDPYEGCTYTYHYDQYNQCTGYTAGDFSVRKTDEHTVTYFEDSYMKRSSEMTYDESCLMSPRIIAVNDLIGQQQRRGSSVVPSDIGIVRYTYDLLGRVTGKTIQATYDASKPISISSSYLTGTTIKSDISVTFPTNGVTDGSDAFRYTFDERGRIIQEISNMGTSEFAYDIADHLTAEIVPTGGSKQYTYYADGSIASESLAADQTIEYTYDRGRLVSRGAEAYSYDNLGNCVFFNGTPLAWHRGSLLKQYGSEATAITYRYDNQGVRFAKACGEEVTTRFFHDGAKIVDEYRGNIRIRYLYDAEEMIGFKVGSDYFYYVKDALGNVRTILRAKKIISFEQEGEDSYEVSEVARYTYDAWGNCTATAIGDATIGGVSIADFNPIRPEIAVL